MLDSLMVANQNSQIETEIRDMRKGTAGIEGQRSQRGENGFGEITAGCGDLGRGELRVFEYVDALFLQAGQKLEAQTILASLIQFGNALADGDQFIAGSHAVRPGFERTALHLTLQASDPHHEKLVEIGAYDGKKLQTLEQGILLVLSLLENARLESQ